MSESQVDALSVPAAAPVAAVPAGPEGEPQAAAAQALRPEREAPTAPITVPWESELPGITTAEIRAELARRQHLVPKLMAERSQILRELEAIEQVLAAMGEELPEVAERLAAPARAPRARNAASLRDALAAAVPAGATVTPAEAVEAVRRNGYVSSAAKFGQIVAVTLARDARFERLGRGRYRRTAS